MGTVNKAGILARACRACPHDGRHRNTPHELHFVTRLKTIEYIVKRRKEQQKIVFVGHLPDWVIEKFFSDVQVIFIEESSRSDLLSSLDEEVVGIVARGSALIDSEVIQAAPNLRVIARTGAGYNTVDVEAASLRKIPVLYTPGAMSRAVAEHTVGLILAAAKDLCGWHQRVLKGAWQERYHRVIPYYDIYSIELIGQRQPQIQFMNSSINPFWMACMVDQHLLTTGITLWPIGQQPHPEHRYW